MQTRGGVLFDKLTIKSFGGAVLNYREATWKTAFGRRGRKMVKIRLYVQTSMVGSIVEETIDVPDDWESMDEQQRQEYLDEAAEAHVQNNCDYGAYVMEDSNE